MRERQSRPADPGGDKISVSRWIAHMKDSLSYCAVARGRWHVSTPSFVSQPYQISPEAGPFIRQLSEALQSATAVPRLRIGIIINHQPTTLVKPT
jgi:hypothetical protein